MAAVSEKVAFAENAITVHVKRMSEPGLLPDGTEAWDVESKLMRPGQTMPLSDMPPYLSDAIKEGQVPGLKAMTPAQVKKRVEFYSEMMGLNSPDESSNEEQEEDPGFLAEEF